ncbi:hypothetical protein ACHAXR_009140 [Thalassiosira sp. AJA248-18]
MLGRDSAVIICAAISIFVGLAAVISVIVIYVGVDTANRSKSTDDADAASVKYVAPPALVSNNSSSLQEDPITNKKDDGTSTSSSSSFGSVNIFDDASPSSSYPGLRPSRAPMSSFSSSSFLSLTPSSYPVSSWEVVDLIVNNAADDIVQETSEFDGPLSDFVVITDLARSSSTITPRSSTGGCTAATNKQVLMRFTLETDPYAWETSWELYHESSVDGDEESIMIASGPPNGRNYERSTRYIGQMCLEAGSYLLRVKDDMGDGICCEWGQGSYTVTIDGDTVVESDDSSFEVKDVTFVVKEQPSALLQPALFLPLPAGDATRRPTPRPVTRRPTPRPTRRPTPRPVTRRPTPPPTRRPTPPLTPQIVESIPTTKRGFCQSTFYEIEEDIVSLVESIQNDQDKAHLLGGTVRLAAHDFMDFDRRSSNNNNRYGPDGCFDPGHPANAGLEDIWCDTGNCELKKLYDTKYSSLLSRADFWIAASCGVIHYTSNGELDLIDTFRWGRRDRDTCPGSGDRVPAPSRCDGMEDAFLTRMGLNYKDAVALMGGHTLGRGDNDFSGHHGTWVDNNQDAQVFDKQYYEEIFLNAWRPRTKGWTVKQDWTTGRGNINSRVMLNTDICLVFDIDSLMRSRTKCCTRTNQFYDNGQNQCVDREASRRRCPMYSSNNPRREMADAVQEMLGGSYPNTNNQPFYDAFAEAWEKATTLGQTNLSTLDESC